MNRKYIPIVGTVAVLLVTAIIFFVTPVGKVNTFARVVMDNSGGRVIFNHSVHADEYGYECTDCHHDDIGAEAQVSCATCHPVSHDEIYRTTHQKAFDSTKACLRCHDSAPSGPLSPEDRPDTDNIPLKADAFHQQCTGCHESDGGPWGDDACYQCHARRP